MPGSEDCDQQHSLHLAANSFPRHRHGASRGRFAMDWDCNALAKSLGNQEKHAPYWRAGLLLRGTLTSQETA